MDSNTPNIPIKLRLASGKSCRRARIEIPLTMSMVKSKILTSFPELKSGQFTMNYQDEEGDQIEVVNDLDLAEALAVFNAIGRVLSFTICPKTVDSESDDTDDADGSANHDNDCSWRQHWRQHWRHHGHHGHGRHGHRARRWHALAHMLGMRPQDMKPEMQNMMRFGMLKHFVGHRNRHVQTSSADETCEPDLKCTFVSDVTFNDGVVLRPNQSFNKKWLVKTGDKAWPAGCTLVHVGGHPMGTRRPKHPKFTLGPVPADSEIEVMVVLQAPKRKREFVSKWRMCTPDGVQFGDCLWANISVDARAAIADVKVDLECEFVADDSIPDGTTMAPNQQFNKRWVVNTGKTPWPAGCSFVHVSGHALGTKRRKFMPTFLPATPANSKIILEATMQAPRKTNNFISKWRMCTPDGHQFGDFLWTFINVDENDGKAPATDLKCTFVDDATIPDRSLVPPKEFFMKKWIVKTGPKAWPAGCVLTHVGGHPMGTKSSKAKPAPLGPVPANSEIELEVGLKAPKPSRDFVSKWRMSTPDGHQFGDFLWTIITVDPDSPSISSSAAAVPPLPPAPVTTKAAAAASVSSSAAAVAKPVDETWVVVDKPVAAKPSVVVVKPVPPPVDKPAEASAAASASATNAVTTDPKLQQLLDMNFPVPEEVLAQVLKSTGGNLHAAIGVLLAQ